MNASIVVLTFNNLERCTKKCIKTILEFTDLNNNELIIVDNNSSDSTVHWLDEIQKKNSDKNILLIKNEKNFGYAGGNNTGIEHSKGKYIILLNNDTEVCENWVENLTSSFSKDPELGLVSPITNRIGSLQQITIPGLDASNWGEKVRPYITSMKGRYFYTSKVCFFCVCIPRKVIGKVGFLDPNYGRGNFEDDDYCLRVLKEGFKIRVNEDLFIFHHGSLSFAGFSESELEYTNFKNQRFFEKKHSVNYSFSPLIREFSKYCEDTKNDQNLNIKEKCDCILYHKGIVDTFKEIELSLNIRKQRAYTGILTFLKHFYKRSLFYDVKNKLRRNYLFLRKYGLRLFILKNSGARKQKSEKEILVQDIPIFILSFNRLECLRLLLERLKQLNVKNRIIVIDNNSTYEPLLRYYETCGVEVVRLKKNYGHLALWKAENFKEIIENQYFIYTDADVVPLPDCPPNFIDVFYQILKSKPFLTKVGFSLSLKDIPDEYPKKEEVVKWEEKFWDAKKRFVFSSDISFFDAPIDTTFALYRPGVYPYEGKWWRSVRTSNPYAAEHLGWNPKYIIPEEMMHYQRKIKKGSSHWFSDNYLTDSKED